VIVTRQAFQQLRQGALRAMAAVHERRHHG
jgi:hypothetical protein